LRKTEIFPWSLAGYLLRAHFLPIKRVRALSGFAVFDQAVWTPNKGWIGEHSRGGV
jgi:hypothetical protein